MPVKRQTSISVADLHFQQQSSNHRADNLSLGSSDAHAHAILTKGIKRLALDPTFVSSNSDPESHQLLHPPTEEPLAKSATTYPSIQPIDPYTSPISPEQQSEQDIQYKKKLEAMAAYVKTILSQVNDQDFDTKYEFGKEIGKGGFSCVYQCRDRVTGNIYAVKVGHPTLSFLRLSLVSYQGLCYVGD